MQVGLRLHGVRWFFLTPIIMIEFLIANPLLLLFLVIAIGYPLGNLRIGSFSLGVAAVLFAGLGVGALHPDLRLPELVYQLGLVLFIYTIGLSSGASFFTSLRRKGVRDIALVMGVLGTATAGAWGLAQVWGLQPTLTLGMFTGAITNTPALASVLETLKAITPPALHNAVLAEPVVGYSLTYPMGVVAMLLVITVLQKLWKVDYAAEAERLRAENPDEAQPINHTIRVTRPEVVGQPVQNLLIARQWRVVFARLKRNGHEQLVTASTALQLGDLVSVIGTEPALAEVTVALGEPDPERLELDRSEIDYRRVFVSNRALVGRRLRDLNLPQRFEAVVTRIRRGDLDVLPSASTILHLGDRVRVVTRRDNLDAVTRYFGDSYRALSEIDVLTFSLGLAIGLAVGQIAVPLPTGGELKLGLAGGPLVVALLLGAFHRTGPLVWDLPYSANLTLRQVGLVLFLAGIGTRAGYSFFSTITQGNGPLLFLGGVLITTLIALLTLWVGYKILRIPMSVLTGMLAGIQTQPAVLAFAQAQTKNDLPSVGYAAVFPIATVAKIILAQVLLALL